MSKRKNKRKSEPEMDTHTKAVIEEAIRIRTRMRIRDCEGKERIFRSTVAETEEGAEDETEEDTG